MSNFANVVANLSFNGEEARAFADTVITDAYDLPNVRDFHTVYDGIKVKKQIPFIGRFEKITKADTGCDTEATTQTLAASEKFWNPNPVEAWIKQCQNDMEGSFLAYLTRNGLSRYNFTDTDVYRFLIEIMTYAANEDALRQAWFSDENYIAGNLGNGAADLPNYDIYDGFWAQIFDIVTADASRRYTIAENGNASKATQALADDEAYNVYQALTEDADTRIYQGGEPFILSTRSLTINYKRTLRSKNVPESFGYIQGRPNQLAFDGVPIIEVNQWDRIIKSDFDNGTTWDRPHRAVLTNAANLAIGFDAADDVGSWEGWYERKDKEVNIRGNYKVDAKVLKDNMIQTAY